MSKKSFGLIFSIAFIFCAFLQVSAQESTFTFEELSALRKAAEEKLKGKTYRRTTTETSYSGGSKTPTSTTKTIMEVIPPDRYRYMSVAETSKGIKRYEFIKVGKRSFERENNGAWKELPVTGYGSGVGGGSGDFNVKIEKTIERTLKKGVLVNNQTVDLYETLSNYKFIYPTKTITKIWKESYSFDAGGRFVRYVEEFQEDGNDSSRKTVEEYEYDPNIKIEAPIKSRKTKSSRKKN